MGTVGGPLQRKGLRALKWLVVRDFAPTETAEFWRIAPELERGEVRSEDIATEVFFFPAAAHTEKEGTFTNTQRLLQWREKAVEPPGDARSEYHFVVQLGRRLKAKATSAPRDAGLRALTWDYADEDVEEVLHEIHGWRGDHEPIKAFADLKADGTTTCGCWIYSG